MPRQVVERTLLHLAAAAGLVWRLRRPILVTIGELLGLTLTIVGVALWSGRAAVVLAGVITTFAAWRWDR